MCFKKYKKENLKLKDTVDSLQEELLKYKLDYAALENHASVLVEELRETIEENKKLKKTIKSKDELIAAVGVSKALKANEIVNGKKPTVNKKTKKSSLQDK